MTESEIATFIGPYIQLVRAGSFTKVLEDQAAVKRLKTIADRKDYLGAQSKAILAESHDQVGKYRTVAENYANLEIGEAQLANLTSEIGRLGPAHKVVRAHAWLLLQCAISEFRREGGHKHGLELLTKGIDLISAQSGEPIDSQHIQGLFYFWRARIRSTALYDFRGADQDFELALRTADETFADKLREADEDAGKPIQQRRRDRPTELAVGAYILSTVYSFGLAAARQQESRLLDSLWFLRAAVPLSRGGQDFHRRGFVHLLMGTALRGLARRGHLSEAIDQLQKARELLEGSEPHLLHLARVSHQRALAHYNDVPPGVVRLKKHKELLEEALKDNLRASELSGDNSYTGFRDPLLEYGIKVAVSLIHTSLGDFDTALRLADEAIRSLSRDVPRGTHGWAQVAMGMAYAERVERSDQSLEIEKAERALQVVVDDTDLRPTDQAAAHLHLSRLYSKIGQPFKANIHYDRAQPLIEESEHGWLKDLQESARVSLTEDTGPELRINIQDLLSAAKADSLRHRQSGKTSAWKSMNRSLDLNLKRRLLSLSQHQALLRETNGEAKLADQLGIPRSQVFIWKKDPALKLYFPPRGGRATPSTNRPPTTEMG